ncbi:hypothetical protein D9M68_769070 [compost metagenome]
MSNLPICAVVSAVLCCVLLAGNALRTGQTGSLSARKVATASSKMPDMVRLASAATVGAPRFAVLLRMSRTCAGVICRTGILPIEGKTTRCSMSSLRRLVTSSQSFNASHSLTTASNVLAESCSRLIRSTCLF